jgi:TonB family protein
MSFIFNHSNRGLSQTFREVLFLGVILCSVPGGPRAYGQQLAPNTSSELDRGIRSYTEGDTKTAINAFRAVIRKNKGDGDAWYYLGLALARVDDMKGARKAFETAVKLRPDFGPARTGFSYTLMLAGKDEEAERQAARAVELSVKDAQAHYILGMLHLRATRNREAMQEAVTAIALKPDFAIAYLLKSQVLLGIEGEDAAKSSRLVSTRSDAPLTGEEVEKRRQGVKKKREIFRVAAESLEMYLKLAASDRETATWKEQLETLRLFAGLQEAITLPVIMGSWDVTTKVRVLSKSEPTYTESARAAGIVGTVILRAVFSADGKVEHILVLRSLPGGLTEQSIQAARKIIFTPATKDGRPVSMIMDLQYNFMLG